MDAIKQFVKNIETRHKKLLSEKDEAEREMRKAQTGVQENHAKLETANEKMVAAGDEVAQVEAEYNAAVSVLNQAHTDYMSALAKEQEFAKTIEEMQKIGLQ